jgi:phosphopantetheinyl transferase
VTWACAAPLEQVLAPLGADLGWLGPAERERCARFAGEQRRRQFVGGRWLARRLLAHVVGTDPARVMLAVDAEGRSLAPPPWRLSISHSGGWVGVALADAGPVGLDLQLESPGRDWRALAAFAGLQPCPDAAHFYRHWTLAEAWLKAHPGIASLAELRGLRWRQEAAGPAWHGQEGGLHWALVGASAPRWVDGLLPQGLQPAPGEGWAPLDGTLSAV